VPSTHTGAELRDLILILKQQQKTLEQDGYKGHNIEVLQFSSNPTKQRHKDADRLSRMTPSIEGRKNLRDVSATCNKQKKKGKRNRSLANAQD
jgi:hypothetical protein